MGAYTRKMTTNIKKVYGRRNKNHLASLVFDVDEEDVTDTQRLLVKLISSGSGARAIGSTVEAIAKEENLFIPAVVQKVVAALKSVRLRELCININHTNLPERLKRVIRYSCAEGMYGIVKNMQIIQELMEVFFITELRKAIGKTNLRMRMLIHSGLDLAYEVANGDLEMFKSIVDSVSIKTDTGDIKLVCYKVTY